MQRIERDQPPSSTIWMISFDASTLPTGADVATAVEGAAPSARRKDGHERVGGQSGCRHKSPAR
jgi:hypothetical protein